MAAEERFDPLALVAAFEREGASYVLVGALARVLQGADELTRGVDFTPSLREKNLERVEAALEHLEAQAADRRKTSVAERIVRGEEVIRYRTRAGELKLVPRPEGTEGYDDLRRRARREYLGQGVRAQVASINDLARMLAAREREQDLEPLLALRRLHELERTIGRSLELGR
ncbi:MAG TPA: hypothetical protein VFO88_07495 [Gaiellaceae bacterium]|nr:hypothetical protein [Gaiellaceae bacterium]